jgi:hypothetical protein
LVGSAKAGAIVAIEVFVKPIKLGIGCLIECTGGSAEEWPLTFLIAKPEFDQTV